MNAALFLADVFATKSKSISAMYIWREAHLLANGLHKSFESAPIYVPSELGILNSTCVCKYMHGYEYVRVKFDPWIETHALRANAQ